MSIKALLENQVSTKFLLSMAALIGTFTYGWIGPLANKVDTGGDVLDTAVKIVGIYVIARVIRK